MTLPDDVTPPTPQDQGAAQRELADLQLVDALLVNLAEQSDQQREHRVQRVMQQIATTAAAPSRRQRALRWATAALAAAASLALATLVLLQLNNRTLADEVLLEISKVSCVPADRVYGVTRQLPGTPAAELPHGTLYLRGHDGLVLTWGDVTLGRWGSEFWVVEQRHRVLLADSFNWIDQHATDDALGTAILKEVSLHSRHVPLMQLASVAELMQHDYEVQLTPAMLHGQTVDLLVGQRRRDSGELPLCIRLWADPRSRVVEKAELVWQPGNSVVLELDPAAHVERSWYDYAAHCEGPPQVRRVSAPDQ